MLKFETVDEYLAQVESDTARDTLTKLRAMIRRFAPEAQECISYGMPGYKQHGYLCGFAAFKNHCSFFPGGIVPEFADRLSAYQTSKGTIQFANDHLLPADLVRDLIQTRLADNLARHEPSASVYPKSMDLKASAFNGLKRALDIFRQDLEALPEDAFDRKLADKARTVADIVHEVNLVNDHIGATLRGEPTFEWPEGWVTAPEDLRTKAAVLAAFQASSQRALDTADSFSAEEMVRTIVGEHGETTPFDRFRFMAVHLWYHSGQLNFIQTLLGDDSWHWE